MKTIQFYLERIPRYLLVLLTLPLLFALVSGLIGAVSANHAPGSIPYQGAETQGPDHAAFNIYSGDIPGNPSSIGEQDFVTVSPAGERDWSNEVEVCEGQADVHIYVHNGAEVWSNHVEDGDYQGDGVATGTRLRVVIPDGEANTHTVEAYISSDNTVTISDGAQITCNDHPIELTYVSGSAQVYRAYTRNIENVSEEIFSEDGMLIGYKTDDGIVPGCWEYRLYYIMTVEVEKVEEPKEEKKLPVCEALTVGILENRTVEVDVAFAANDAEVSAIRVDFGDGTIEDFAPSEFPSEYTYSDDGDYNLVATVLTDMGDVTSEACKASVTFETPEEEPEKPEEPELPAELPVTGMGGVAGLFAATSTIGALAHRIFTARRGY